jgi:hypothetical protein
LSTIIPNYFQSDCYPMIGRVEISPASSCTP